MRFPGVLLFYLLIGMCCANRNDPHSYFGGTEHDDYIEWYENTGASLYNASTFLSSTTTTTTTQGAAVHWSLNDTHIALAVAVRATGWLGFGLSENGGMRGADVFLFETARPDQIRDAHVLDEVLVPVTDCQQDWDLEAWYDESLDFLIVQVTRALDTNDPQDRPIVTATDVPPTRIIAAWGDTPEAQYHGPNRVRGAVQWTQDGMQDFAAMMGDDAQTFRVAAMNYSIPVQETEYAIFCLNATDAVRQGVPSDEPISIIGVEAVIDATRHVHHLIVYGFPDADCNSMERSLVYIWGPGEHPMTFPSDVALYAGPGHSLSFRMEIHYDNADLEPDVQDSTAVQFYYTTEMRPVQADILQLGDPFVQLSGTEVGEGEHIFECPSSCTQTVLNESVTVLREYLHMHAQGAQAQNEVLREGEVVNRASIEFFDFNQQGNQAVQQIPYQIEPGDSFRTTCRYEPGDDTNTTFGLASQDEMCIAFILYYPRQTFTDFPWACGYDIPFGFCSSTWESDPSSNTMSREFGTTNATECPVSASRQGGTVTEATTPGHMHHDPHMSEATTNRGCMMIVVMMVLASLF